jgi:hypothetical protein
MLRWDRSSTDEERLTDGRRDDTRIGASHEQTIVASFLGDVNVRGRYRRHHALAGTTTTRHREQK